MDQISPCLRVSVVFSCLALSGCADGAAPSPAGAPSASAFAEPRLPTPSSNARALEAPAWARKLPAVAPQAAAGAQVWATPPVAGTEMAETAVFRVEAVHATSATLVDRLGQRIDDVPGAVVHAVGERVRLRQGQPALCYSWTTSAVLCRIGDLATGREIAAAYDWAGTTREAAVDHAEPLVAGVRPLAFVGFPKAGALSMGLLVALDETQGWVRTSSGHVEMLARGELRALGIGAQSLRVGDAVHAYVWATGFQPAEVTRVVETGLRYAVRPRSGAPEQEHFFATLVKAAPDGGMR